MQIYIATHKPAPFPDDPGYIPIHNGKATADIVLPIIGDDTGRSISAKVATFSECCTLYWMAENVEAEFVGLAHYRRYFSPLTRSVRVGDYDVAASDDFPEIADLDLIVAQPMDFGHLSVEQQYAAAHFERDMAIARGAVRKLYPAYLDTFDRAMAGRLMTPYNLFVGRSVVLKEYAKWLFDIMFLLEEWVPYQSYNEYQTRVFAFLSERLFTVWLQYNERNWRIITRHVLPLPY